MEWYYVRNEERIGPISEEALRNLVASGVVQNATLVWYEGMDEWLPYREVALAETTPELGEPVEDAQAARCAECNKAAAENEMIRYENAWVCADCKDTFFQRLREGTGYVVMGGNTPNHVITAKAREVLSDMWGTSVGVTVVYLLIWFATSAIGGLIMFSDSVLQLVLFGPLQLGLSLFYLGVLRRQHPEFATLFAGFNKFGTSIGIYFFTSLITGAVLFVAILPGGAVLGFLFYTASQTGTDPEAHIALMIVGFALAGIPLVIVSFWISAMFALSYFLVADDDVGCFDALRQSFEMMKGYKWKLICLWFRFAGWSILCVFPTLGIGFLWLIPYMSTAQALFYEDLRRPIAGDRTPTTFS